MGLVTHMRTDLKMGKELGSQAKEPRLEISKWCEQRGSHTTIGGQMICGQRCIFDLETQQHAQN